jgi:hypothetical protein
MATKDFHFYDAHLAAFGMDLTTSGHHTFKGSSEKQ